MAVHTVTLHLPQLIYEQIERAAKQTDRRIDELLLEVVVAVAPVIDGPSQDVKSAMAQMAFLNDAALWQAARSTMPLEQRERLEALHLKQQDTGLTASEQQEEQNLLKLYQETLLIRAQAAMLLKQRNYDVSNPEQFLPIE
ncbi:MAG: hypothetical protein R3264_00530 [Anaerolineae bacterium]|nr:hypothetical protein [Anaerolineae bacterium]